VSDAFISYSHLDRDFAIHLQTALKNSGKAIWVDEADIPSGSRWAEDLKRRSRMLTPSSLSSALTQRDLRNARRSSTTPFSSINASFPSI